MSVVAVSTPASASLWPPPQMIARWSGSHAELHRGVLQHCKMARECSAACDSAFSQERNVVLTAEKVVFVLESKTRDRSHSLFVDDQQMEDGRTHSVEV